jgi:signal transduction histidine kinase
MVIGVAHELRTPLTNLRGYLEALRDQVLEPSPETLETLQDETRRLETLVEDLLQLARAGSIQQTLERREVALHDVLVDLLRSYRERFAEKQIQVKVSLDDARRPVRADPEKIRLALNNLLDNAVRYTPRGGRVRVAARRRPEGLRIIVANNGEGIRESDLPYVFEYFYRGEKSRSREHGGAGIGLAVVRELVKAHGGEVGAESDSRETRVWCSFPA